MRYLMSKKVFCLVLLTGFNSTLFSQNSQRYTTSQFAVVQTHTNAIYTIAPQLNSPYAGESQITKVNLSMHIFQPQGDTVQKRPMIVCFHGGGFMSGKKEHDDMIEFSKIFARYGYVTATAQYRLGMNALSNTSAERAVYRAIQDSRALLRYLRQNAASQKISPEHIYILGSSAGAFIALHNIVMNKESERPSGTFAINKFPPTLDNGPDLGTLDAIGGFRTNGSQANGIVALWGAVKHTDLVEINDSKIPMLLVHGTKDSIVPFGLGSPFQLPTLAATYGSQLIDQKLISLNYAHETYFVDGVGHEFYGVLNGMWSPKPNQYWDTVVNKVRDFLFNIHKPTASFSYSINKAQVAFTNTSAKGVKWLWEFGDGETSTLQNPVHTYKQSGTYAVSLTAYSEVLSADTKKENIAVIVTDINSELLPSTTELFQNYPNPFNPETTIGYKVQAASQVSLKVYDVLGNEVATLVNEFKQPGNYQVTFNARHLERSQEIPSGVYFYRLRANQFNATRKFVLMK
ncbi:MAG: PKD domain-containing protein [Stygiobacter sp.]|nr:MAG: PKD domain-containing protein [Stygiobacter sp.]